ncbi:MAG TPA: hypothetical protein VIW67_08115 [Terriglobales bacterium]|jgi:hypothetical protein
MAGSESEDFSDGNVRGRTGIVGRSFSPLGRRWPDWRRNATTPGAVVAYIPPGLGPGDFAHGVVEVQAQDLNEEVDGVAGQLALGPSPVAVLDDQTRIGGQLVVAGFPFDELECRVFAGAEREGRGGRRGFVRDSRAERRRARI